MALALALASAGMVTTAASLPAAAQAQGARLIRSMTTQELAQAMEAIGGASRLNESPATGGLSMSLRFANGINAIAEFNCNSSVGCNGLHLIAFFPPADGMSAEQARERVLRYNWGRAAVSAGLDDTGNMFVSRYIVIDGGITYENLVSNLRVFEALSAEFATI